eukprot:TRINITY_DN51979_c0_g1_i1.p1 TRINITY_DN51979_c0_g1~~TRINITY_DN51979_c0_g1_i1.p1  ORF type:complete len:466 (-),score=30.02 TRINITY_DN51979_c0_g1_i1:114-1511(-)
MGLFADVSALYDPLSVAATLSLAWLLSNVVELIRLPGLIGEVLAGFLLGPFILNACSETIRSGLTTAGNIGVMLMVFEGGLSMNSEVLRQVGVRAFVLAFTGTLLPVVTGWLLMWVLGFPLLESVACGTALSSTAIAFTLRLMQDVRMLPTPTGQLITAAAMIDDVLSLVVLAMLQGLQDPSNINAWAILRPLVMSLGIFILALVYRIGLMKLLLVVCPRSSFLTNKLRISATGNFLVCMMFISLVGWTLFAAAIHSTPLLGTFMAGLAFNSFPKSGQFWETHMATFVTWCGRLFFTATVGMAVPLDALVEKSAILYGLLLTLAAILGKFLSGLWGGKLRPFSDYWRLTVIVGTAMVGRGELGFVLASESLKSGLVENQSYSATVWALVLATILGPIMFRLSLKLKPDLIPPIEPEASQEENSGAADASGFVDLQARQPETKLAVEAPAGVAAAVGIQEQAQSPG